MRLLKSLSLLKAHWVDVGIAACIAVINLIILGQAGLAYGSFDWARYSASPYGPPSGYGPAAGIPYGPDSVYGAWVPYGPYSGYSAPYLGWMVYYLKPGYWLPYVAPYLPSIPAAPAVVCKPAPYLFDPPEGKTFSARSTIFRWRSDAVLEPDEVFDVLVWPEGSRDQVSLGTTREKILPVDFVQWNHAGLFGKFFWTVRIKQFDGPYVSCLTSPFSFVMSGLPGERQDAPEQPRGVAPVLPKPGK